MNKINFVLTEGYNSLSNFTTINPQMWPEFNLNSWLFFSFVISCALNCVLSVLLGEYRFILYIRKCRYKQMGCKMYLKNSSHFLCEKIYISGCQKMFSWEQKKHKCGPVSAAGLLYSKYTCWYTFPSNKKMVFCMYVCMKKLYKIQIASH